MIDTIFQILATALDIWDNHEKTKYIDKLMSLKKDYYEETNKPADSRSDAAIDDIVFNIRLLGLAFSSAAGTKNSPVQPGNTNP